jgi:hypothetical protein
MATMVREFRAVDGRDGMKRMAPLAIAAILGSVSPAPAHAAPPTATPSPGYDARLQEQRAAMRVYEPVAPVTRLVTPRRVKRTPAH